jgi:hypothetical protein
VSNDSDAQGPGEHAGPTHFEPEPVTGPAPDGEMPEVIEPRRLLSEDAPDPREGGGGALFSERSDIRRTSTDQEALGAVRVRVDATEQRVDNTAGDLQREETHDPVQNDAGPESDQA